MDEETTGTSEVNEGNVGGAMLADAMKSLHPEQVEKTETIVPEIKNDEKSDEAKEDVTPEAKPDDKVAEDSKKDEKPTDEKKSETVSADKGKSPYTPAEISRILETGETADTSRMSAETQVYYKEMQKGLTRAFQKAADERKSKEAEIAKREQALRDKEIEDEERKFRAEEELLDPEHARDRQEKRKIVREKDELADRMKAIETRLQQEEQRKVIEANDREFSSVASTINFPNDPKLTPLLQDAAYSYLWARNVGATQMGQPTMSVSDGAKEFANIIGLTNPNNLEKIVNANPKFKEAYEKKVIENYLKGKSAGPTTVRSSVAAAKEKPDSEEGKIDRKKLEESNADPLKMIEEEALKQLRKIKT